MRKLLLAVVGSVVLTVAIAISPGSVLVASAARHTKHSVIATSLSDNVGLLPSLVLVGSAARSPSGIVTLTQSSDGHYPVGAAWTPETVNVSSGFTARFTFVVSPHKRIGAGSDGFAFLVQNDPRGTAAIGQCGAELGYGGDGDCFGKRTPAGISNSVAVEFDTYPNLGAPINDPNGNHISVLTRYGSPNSTDQKYSLGLTSAIPNLHDGVSHEVVVKYTPGRLSIWFDYRLILAVPLNLPKIGLASGAAYVGFTGATGGATETNQILSFKLKNTTP